jgi:hypothetical protein
VTGLISSFCLSLTAQLTTNIPVMENLATGQLTASIVQPHMLGAASGFMGYITNGAVAAPAQIGCYLGNPSDCVCTVSLTNLGFYAWPISPDTHSVVLFTNFYSKPFAWQKPPLVLVSPANFGYHDDYYANRGLYASAWCDPTLSTTNYAVILGDANSPAIGCAMHETNWAFTLQIIGNQ